MGAASPPLGRRAAETTALIDDQRSAAASEDDSHLSLERTSGIDDDDEPLASGGVVNILTFHQSGYLAQYFAVGLIYGGLPATVYGFFIGYLNVPAYVYSTAGVIMTLPWSFKFLFGLLNDCVPIGGYRRKPYMCLGWAFCSAMLLLLAQKELPPPYWCRDESGVYVTTVTAPDGSKRPAEPCNASAALKGGGFALLMMLAALGYVVADVAADGLTVQYARREPRHQRGRTQTTAYMTRTMGQVTAILLIGFGMNSKEYNGTFERGLSFNAICAILAVPAGLMVPISWLLIQEQRVAERPSLRGYLVTTRELLKSRAMFYVVLYQFLTPVIGNISTTSGGLVKRYWAGVQNLQNQLFSLVGHGLFALGLLLVRRHFLDRSWRGMLLLTTVLLNVVDMPFVFLTIYSVIRNQYFYLGETVLIEVPAAANFVVSTFVIVEMADNVNEGLVYGLLTTTHNLGGPFARAIGNQIFGLFQPSLSDAANYLADTPRFRDTVALSFVLSYAFAFASLAVLVLLPDQKAEAQRRKRTWPQRPRYAVLTLVLIGSALTYALSVNLLSMFEGTMCLRFAGGSGCGEDG